MPRGKRETLKEKEGRAEAIVERLTRVFPDARVPLHHRNPFELLVATILSAQSTDEQVNKITPKFFDHYPNPEKLAPDLSRKESLSREKTQVPGLCVERPLPFQAPSLITRS